MKLIEMKVNEEDGFWCDECGGEAITLVEINNGGYYMCQSCLQKALAMVKGEDNVRG